MHPVTFCTWNLKTPGGKSASESALPPTRVDLIREVLQSPSPVVMAMQEVTPGYARSLAPLGLHHSLSFRRPGEFDGGNRMLGVGLLTSGDVEVRDVGVVQRAPFPAHAEGRLVYNGADRDGQNGNPGFKRETLW